MASTSYKNTALLSFSSSVLLLLCMVLRTTMAVFHVKTLPGYTSDLPFYMETGYISVGDVEYFYYFVESQSNPSDDPLLLFINGGPGCSALNGFLFETGPLMFKAQVYNGSIPTLVHNPYAWTQVANIIYIDAPVGTGFTYATTTEAWNTNNTYFSQQLNIFTRKWLQEHNNFLVNPFYVATDSFVGIINPVVAQDILQGNEAGLVPHVNLKGLSLSCPHTDYDLETDTKVDFAHRLALISDELYEAAKTSCNGSYSDPATVQCSSDLDAIAECTNLINTQNILIPLCATLSPEQKEEEEEEGGRRSLAEKSNYADFYCKYSIYQLAYIWANLDVTRDALGIRNGTIESWVRCNLTLNGYYNEFTNSVPYHKNLTKSGLQLLVFSGDHDMVVPYLAVQYWIRSLGLPVDDSWRPWFVDGQIAGYTVRYTNAGYRLTFATVKGAGHSPPEYKPQECYELFNRWIHYYPV